MHAHMQDPIPPGADVSRRFQDMSVHGRQTLHLPLSRSLFRSAKPLWGADTKERCSIDGVLLRSASPIPGASETLAYLQKQNVPFVLLTNGGGRHESDRVKDLTAKLGVPLDEGMFIQSHTPFAAMAEEGALKDEPVLVVGGAGDDCRKVAEQ